MRNDQISFSNGQSSCSTRLPQVAEIGNEIIMSQEDQTLANDSNQHYIRNFTNDTWNGSTFNSLSRARDDKVNVFPSSNASDIQVILAARFKFFPPSVWQSALCLSYHVIDILFNRTQDPEAESTV